MIDDLTEEFDISDERAMGITDLVRHFISNPKYETFDKHDQLVELDELTKIYTRFEYRDFSYRDVFMKDLPLILRNMSGDTIEDRWNNLMDLTEYQKLAEGGVYLKPWTDLDPGEREKVGEPGVVKK